jgi:hypothetical protein
LTVLAQIIDTLAWVALCADVLEITFNFEMLGYPAILLHCIGINSGACKLIYIVLDERCVKGKTADHLAF